MHVITTGWDKQFKQLTVQKSYISIYFPCLKKRQHGNLKHGLYFKPEVLMKGKDRAMKSGEVMCGVLLLQTPG